MQHSTWAAVIAASPVAAGVAWLSGGTGTGSATAAAVASAACMARRREGAESHREPLLRKISNHRSVPLRSLIPRTRSVPRLSPGPAWWRSTEG